MVDFYERVLGFEVSDRGSLDASNPDLEIAFLSQIDTDHHQLAMVPIRGEGPPTTINHLAFRVEDLAEVKAVATRIEADGGTPKPVNHGNAWSVYFSDPEGNGLEVFCDSPWHVRQPQAKAWDLAMSEDELRERTQTEFGQEPDFQPMQAYHAARRRRFGG